jgi:hypothetical protein
MAASLRDAVWLAQDEFRRTWPVLLVTGGATLLFGLIVALTFEGVYSNVARGEHPADFGLSLLLLLLVPNLLLNWFLGAYMAPWRDFFTQQMAFYRSMPIPVRDLVRSRAVTMLVTLAFAAPVFFAPAYLISGGLREEVAVLDYLGFVLFWIGYALLAGGAHLCFELTMSGKLLFAMQCAFVAVIFAALFVLYVGYQMPLATRVMELVQAYGPLLPATSLLLGAAGFWVGVRVAGRRLGMRDLSA